MENIYEKNLSVLEKVNPQLYKELQKINSNERFEVFQGEHEYAINIQDTQTGEFLYQNPVAELELQKKKFEKFREYDYLYIFGMGNGLFIKELLKNPKHLRIVVVEPELELLYIALNLNDFSQKLKERKIIFLTYNNLDFNISVDLFVYKTAKIYAKVYSLLSILPFYEKYYADEMINTNKILTDALKYVITFAGNDITDSLTGVKHHIANLKQMLQNPKFSELKTKKNSNLAIIVSTGPSLYKQLPKLKEIQEFVTIISVDASFPILEKQGIKPDIVTSIERIALTSTFFENTSEEFQKDVICVSASLQHKKVLNAIKGTKVLVMRPFDYNMYFKLDDYGYVGSGMSAANLAHELAIEMGYKTVVLIGQDLAYGKDGNSHAKGHVLGEDEVKEKEDDVILPAYGGKGTVKSTRVWNLFRDTFIKTIQVYSHKALTINATEGGCQIDGTKEMSFDEIILKHVNQQSIKSKITLTYPEENVYKKLLNQTETKLQKLISNGEKLQKNIEKSFIKIQNACKPLENIDENKALYTLSNEKISSLLDEIESIRNKVIDNTEFKEFFENVIEPYLLHYEIELATIKTIPVNNPIDNQKKALQWILAHRYWLFTLAGTIKNTLDIIKNSRKEWDK